MEAITEGNINEVTFTGLSFNVNKNCGLPGEDAPDDKVKLDLTIVWDGNKFNRMLKNASEVEAKNWYNNHRPSTDEKVMSASECKRRIDYLRALAGSPVIINASETGADKVTELSVEQLVQIATTGNPAQVAFAKSKLEAKQAEQDKITQALASLNMKADRQRSTKVGVSK